MQNGKKKVLALLLAGCCVLSACGTKTDDTKTAEKGNFVTGTVGEEGGGRGRALR